MTIAATPAPVTVAGDANWRMRNTPELGRHARHLARQGAAAIDDAASFWGHTDATPGARAVLAAMVDYARQLRRLPLQDVVTGVPCTWCSDDDAWACVRVWDEHAIEGDQFDVEVCPRCASRLLDQAPDWVQSEPMTEDDYHRHGLHAGPRPLDEWDLVPTVPFDMGDDQLRLDGAA